MASGDHLLTTAEINVLLAKTVSAVTADDIKNILDTLSRKSYQPTDLLGSILP